MDELGTNEPRKLIAVIAAYDQGSTSGGLATRGSRGTPGPRLAPGHARMLAALERVFPVCFEQLDADDLDGADGALVLGSTSLTDPAVGVPRLVLPSGAPREEPNVSPTNPGDSAGSSDRMPISLANEARLARPLRGQTIHESSLPCELPLPPREAHALASFEGRPVWWQLDEGSATLDTSAFALSELMDGETLRDHLRAGRFMGLLPLVHFLGQTLGEDGWTPPPLRAAFVIDDPNLHWPSYGFLDYRELIEHATHHGYHVGFATVPLDGWLVNRRAASLLAQNTSVLSLLVHGNDHVARELGRLDNDAEAEASIAQGLRRIAALERRAGVRVDRVLAPPHGACSEAALRATFKLGAEAACISRPYPWRDGQSAATPIAGWHPADLVAGGLPVLPRYPLSAPREDLALRALLGQPLILYGHHGDFAQGLDVLAQATSDVNALGDVQWGSLGWIARGNYSTRRIEDLLLVKLHARRIALEVPAGVRSLRVLADEPHGGAAGHRLAHTRGSMSIAFADGLGTSEPLTISGPSQIQLTLAADAALSPAEVRSRASRPWPLIRRVLVEARDRLQALR
jgi:hypothetical protein